MATRVLLCLLALSCAEPVRAQSRLSDKLFQLAGEKERLAAGKVLTSGAASVKDVGKLVRSAVATATKAAAAAATAGKASATIKNIATAPKVAAPTPTVSAPVVAAPPPFWAKLRAWLATVRLPAWFSVASLRAWISTLKMPVFKLPTITLPAWLSVASLRTWISTLKFPTITLPALALPKITLPAWLSVRSLRAWISTLRLPAWVSLTTLRTVGPPLLRGVAGMVATEFVISNGYRLVRDLAAPAPVVEPVASTGGFEWVLHASHMVVLLVLIAKGRKPLGDLLGALLRAAQGKAEDDPKAKDKAGPVKSLVMAFEAAKTPTFDEAMELRTPDKS